MLFALLCRQSCQCAERVGQFHSRQCGLCSKLVAVRLNKPARDGDRHVAAHISRDCACIREIQRFASLRFRFSLKARRAYQCDGCRETPDACVWTKCSARRGVNEEWATGRCLRALYKERGERITNVFIVLRARLILRRAAHHHERGCKL